MKKNGMLDHMDDHIEVKPLPYKVRKRTFSFLFLIFIIALPFLYLYASGYRFDYGAKSTFVSTGGIYVAAERTGASIYIDNELVRETRVFRTAFYAQNLDPGTHRVHVEKEGHHTWVKELPVFAHLVTEAEAFNMPLVPQVRVISPWQDKLGEMIVRTPLITASTTNSTVATTTLTNSAFIENTEYETLIREFISSASSTATSLEEVPTIATTSESDQLVGRVATTTKLTNNVKLYERDGDIYAEWVGSYEDRPYYYCAPNFPRFTGVEEGDLSANALEALSKKKSEEGGEDRVNEIIHPIQTIKNTEPCDPVIRIDRKGQSVSDFDFLPGNSDLTVLALEDGIYVIEIDNRSWQNAQRIVEGNMLRFKIENGSLFVYDGNLIYQIIPEI